MKNIIKISILLSFTFIQAAWAEIVVIANKESAVDTVSVDELGRVYLGKVNTLGSHLVVPLDQTKGTSSRESFHAKVTKKDSSQLNSYWSRMIFTGTGSPPKEVEDSDEVAALVERNKDIIGYIDSEEVEEGDYEFKVILKLP